MTSAIHAFGESALLVEIGEGIDDAHVARARAVADGWEALGHGLAVPTYTSVLLRYDPFTLDPQLAEREAGRLVETATPAPAASFRTIEIPTTYEGPDLEETAERSHLAVDELIALHADRDLRLLAGPQARRDVERGRRVLVHELHVGEQLLAIGGRHLLVGAGTLLDGLVVLGLLDLAGGKGLRLVPELVPRERRVAARAGGREVRDVA